MKGKITNLFIAFMNILLGGLIIIDTYYIPQDITELTIQELSVAQLVNKITTIILIIICIIDLFQYYSHKDSREVKTGYLIGIFTISFLFMRMSAISALPIISGIIVFYSALKDNAVDVDSTTTISIISIICLVILATIAIGYFYGNLGQYLKNMENKNTQKYSSEFFKYITELDIDEIYINVKVNEKYGYINPSGDVVIDFKYEYASPFINIEAYNKTFQVALVTQNDLSYIIMKNERQVMSFKSEVSDLDYESKLKELEKIYTNTLKQTGEMQFEAEDGYNINTASKYDETNKDYTYRYDYNDTYDVIISESNLGLSDKFELARKDNLDIKIELDCEDLDFDENNLYLFSDGSIPYYDTENNEQGWFTSYGKKKTMTGKAQILDFIDNKILIRDYNDNTIYFMNNQYEKISDNYKDIYILDDEYIVKNENNKYCIIDKNFQKKFDEEFDIIDTSLSKYDVFICANSDKAIDFNDYNFAIMDWKIIDINGNCLMNNVEQIYSLNYKISNDKNIPYVTRYDEFLSTVKNINSVFVGDKFYSSYLK